MLDGTRKLRRQEADQPIRLLHVAGDLGEVAVRRHADRASERFADVVLNRLLDRKRNRSSVGGLALAPNQLADHLVDGRRVRHRAAALDRRGDVVAELRVDRVRAVDENDLGADTFGFAYLGERLDAERLGLVACRDERAGIGHGAAHANWLATIFRMKLLFDRREEAVEIDVEEAEAIGLCARRHGFIIFALASPGSPAGEGLMFSASEWMLANPQSPIALRGNLRYR